MTTLGVILIGAMTALGANSEGLVLRNQEMLLQLDAGPGGVPRIAAAKWCDNEAVIFEDHTHEGLDAWFRVSPRPLAGEGPGVRAGDSETAAQFHWYEVPSEHFLRAEASRPLSPDLEATWVVELAKSDAVFRVQCRLTNRSQQPVPVERFPIFVGDWQIPGANGQVRWWEALSFRRLEQTLTDQPLRLESRYHSSDRRPIPGVNPYWMLLGDRGRLMFGLAWCGGWQADLQRRDGAYHLSVGLPPEETQLVLQPGETISGPVLIVVPARETDERLARARWLTRRASLGKALYGGPAPAFPFVWNHWYTVRFNIADDFLRRQVAAMEPYGFDYFVVDAGWYEACGRWVPDAKKFLSGSFETLLAEAKQKGPKLGIWTCPQFVQADAAQLPDEVDRPGYYERFIDGHLLDLAGCGFRKRLLEHVAMLRERYHADWWKYDQIFFTAQTRQGVMRNVLAFQDALEAVRKAQPDLYIESCQSGGRMINEFTVPIAQGQWLCDGGETGLKHARANFAEALGALEFLPPHTAARWMNRPDDNDPDDDALTRMYCRSCMVGTWGLVADLPRIADRQRQVILDEVKHYRRLNQYKTHVYDLYPARSGKPFAGVVFYAADGRAAGILLARTQDGPFEAVLPLGGLAEVPAYRVEDVDQPGSSEQSAAALRREGLRVSFPAERLSALLFVEPSEPARPKNLIGYTEFRTNLPGGRWANVTTMRAHVVQADGTGRRPVAQELINEPNVWTQFAGWSPDGKTAIVARGWNDPENGRWEDEHRTFRMEPGKWLLDSYLLDLATGRLTNVTAVERVSHYNGGLFYLPGGQKLAFNPLIDGLSKPYVMDLDGRHKQDVSGGTGGFAYGYSASPDGKFISYHEDYQIYLANADGSGKRRIETGNPFNFGPRWSPDGQWILFSSGQRGNSHPYLVRRDGNGLRKLADTGGYQGWVLFLDVDDYHEGSSDVAAWGADGPWVYFTAKVGDTTTEILRATVDGHVEQLTHSTPGTSTPGTLNYQPIPSPDGHWICFGSNRTGVRQLYVMSADGKSVYPITSVSAGSGALWPHWQPTP